MSDGPSIFSMITGIGKSFGDSYDASRKQALEEEAAPLFARMMGITQGNGAAPAPGAGATMGTLGQMLVTAGTPAAPTFAAAGGAMGDYLKTTRATESGNDDLAANPNSTAKGRYQFTDQTWAGVAKRHPDLGLAPGGWRDPDQQERAMAAFTADNAKALTAAGIPINPGNLYVSHFLGEAGGPKFIAGAMANPDAPAVAFVSPGAARANRSIFFDADGRPKTAGAVYAERTGRFADAGPAATPTLPGAPAQATATADMPATDAQPAQFQIPGQSAPTAAPAAAAPVAQPAAPQGFAGFGSTASRMSADQVAVLQAAWKNPVTRPMATAVYQSILTGKDSPWDMKEVNGQSAWVNKNTQQIVPVTGMGPRYSTERDADGNLFSVNQLSGQKSLLKGAEKDPGVQIAAQVKAREAEITSRGLDPNDDVNRRYILNGTLPDAKDDKDEGAKIKAQIAAREQAAEGLGFVKGTPAWQSYVGSGKIGRDQDVSATDKKAIQEADEGVLSAQTAIDALKQAKDLSKQAYEGPTAGIRSTVTSMFGNENGVATQDLNNVVTTNALGQLKAIFGGNPTEGERAILLQIQGSVSQPDVVRQKIFDRGLALAQKRLEFNQRRAEDLRGGTYYKQDGAPGNPKAAALPKGDARMAIPDGKSAAAALSEAQSVAKNRPDLKPQLQERLRAWGIDPKRLDD